jgi:hypothetical protein
LLLDPEAGPFHLMHLAVEPLVAWTEVAGQLRGRGAALLRKGEMSPASHAEIVAQLRMPAQAMASAEVIVGALVRSGEPEPAGFTEALAASRSDAKRVAEVFADATPGGDAAAFFTEGSAVIGWAIGGGWVDHEITNAQSGHVDLKTSCVVGVTADLLLGCGIYKQCGTAPVAAAQARQAGRQGLRSEQHMRSAGSPPDAWRLTPEAAASGSRAAG